MEITRTAFKDLLIIQPAVFSDARGYFFEPFNEARFRLSTGLNLTFVQDNESMSHRGVLRGLHFQIPSKSQGKLIRVSRGSVLDVVVDLRRSQPTYGQHFSIELSAENKTQLYVPEGFAHGFQVLEDHTVFSYKCTNYYSKEHERSLLWNDPTLHIEWNEIPPIVSEKDQVALPLSQLEDYFL
jgi:dTDP-4-dehydrorhamnose 3,5-epimerase